MRPLTFSSQNIAQMIESIVIDPTDAQTVVSGQESTKKKNKPDPVFDGFRFKRVVKSRKNSSSSFKPAELSDAINSSSISAVKRKFANSITCHPLFPQTPSIRVDFGNESDCEQIPSEQKDLFKFQKSAKSSSLFNSG